MNWRLDAVPPRRVEGRFWRMLAPRWSSAPLSGAGAARRGGRWNAADQPALYLSDSHATAIAEYQQDLPRPGTLTAYDVVASGIVDLTQAEVRRVLDIDETFLRHPWKHWRDVRHARPPGWDFAAAAMRAGWHGLCAPSVQAAGRSLVLWRWNAGDAPVVRHVDPLGDLPADRASWSERGG